MDLQHPNESYRYPKWMKVWQQKLPDVDNQIVHHFGSAPPQVEQALRSCLECIQCWFDSLPLDDRTRAEYERVKSDTWLLQAQVEMRVHHLIREERIALPRPEGEC